MLFFILNQLFPNAFKMPGSTRLGPLDTPIYVIGGLCLWIIFSPLVLPLTVFGGLIRLCLTLSAKVFRPHLIPTSYKDSFFAALYACDQQPLMSVGTSLRVKGHVDTERLMNRFQQCFLADDVKHRYANLYCYFELYYGYVFKRRVENLILKDHFIENTLPIGMDPEEYLEKWLVTDTFRHKPEGQPCWQVLILRKGPPREKEETIISIKMHHGMIDGYSIVHMIDKLTDSKSPYIVTMTKFKNENLLTKLRHILEAPALAFDVFLRMKPWKKDLCSQGNPFQPHWTMSFSTLDQLQVVKEIRKKTGAKFSTVMMSAVTGALKRMYMEDKQVGFEDLPDNIWMESPLGWPDHPSMTKGGRFCNHFTAGIYGTPLKTDNRAYRLQALENDFRDFENHSGMQVMLWVVYVGYWLQPAWMARHFYTNSLSYLWRFSVLYSGLISSPTKVNLVGHQVENIYFLQATASSFPYVSLFLMCSTYDGKLDVSCFASKDLAKNKQELERLIQVHLTQELILMHKEYYCKKEEDLENKCLILDMNAN